MLLLGIHAAIERMEREAFTEGHTHVRPKATRHRLTDPLSPIEVAIQRGFDRLVMGIDPDDPPPSLDIEIPDDVINRITDPVQ